MSAALPPKPDVSPSSSPARKHVGLGVVPTLDSVTTIGEDGSRRFIHPATSRGFFTRWRTVVGVALMAVYILLPWIQVNGNPAVFLDVANRQFHFFGLTFVAQDLWLAFFLVTGLGFALFYVTALLGRVWCGWACPQTVFLDIARRVERLIEGEAPERRRLDKSPWTASKTLKRVVKHTIFAVFALTLTHVFLSYFVSLPQVYSMMRHSPGENWGAFLFVFAMGAALWFDIAWFREQFCIVLCPYGRLQSALVDNYSLVVGYDAKRGEPRGRKGTPGAADCVDCRKCVQVCPTGIDIRQGLQMECIGCAACIDACNTVMTKLDRPQGLIRYDSMNGFAGKKTRWLRPRIFLYTALLLLGAAAMTAGLSTLKPATVSLIRMSGIPYVVENGTVRNQFLLRVLNKRNAPVKFRVEVADAPTGLKLSGLDDGVNVDPLGEQLRPVVVTVPREQWKGEQNLRFRVISEDGKTVIDKPLPLVGPIL
ncbi:cytochrome c oxidase accessory protein CcoG [Verrucomicrobiota bacterium sgz303538]